MSGRTNLKILLIISVFLAGILSICVSVQADPIGWSITRLTDNSYEDLYPQISGSNVVWEGSDGSDFEMFFWDGNSTTQVTNNSYNDLHPQISGSNVVWRGDTSNSEIFFWDGNSTTQVTNNSYNDYDPQISGTNVVWDGHSTDWEIFFWDGTITTQLTNNSYNDFGPQISGTNVVWYGYDGNDWEIFFWDGNTTQVTNNSNSDESPQISGTNVVWHGYDGSDWEIFFWDGDPNNIPAQLTNNSYDDFNPQISGSNVVWRGYDGNDWEIFFWDGDPNNTPAQLTNNSYSDLYLQISGSNVVWIGWDSTDWEIFFWDGTTTTQLTNNSYNDENPQVSGSKVVWRGYDGNDYEIFMATALAIDYYVDDNSPGDPAPGDPNTSDPLEDGSLAHPFDAIQEAIDAATDGNTICVLDGTYTGTGNRDIDFGGKAITVRSWNGPEDCVIDCQASSGNKHRGFVFNSGEDGNSVLDGFHIMNGYENDGGGIRCVNSSPTIRNCVITGNTATLNSDGGGIRCHTSNATITNCTISYNTATRDGAGIWCYSASGNPTISNCTISDNNAGRYGGGVYAAYSSPTISDCNITNNTAPQFGGGIFSRWNNNPTVSDSTISDNSPDGILLDEPNSTLLITGVVHIISNNVVGEGSLQIDPNATLNLDDAEIFTDISGPGTMEVDVGAELVIDGNAVIDLGDPFDPNIRGTIDCNGFLEVKENARITKANINVARASFTDDVNVSHCVITVNSKAPYGQFFIDANAIFVYNDIHADGDRYMNLDPNIFSGLFVYNRIFVTITEGVGQTRGGLFELRGDPNFADPNDPNEFMCQMDPCTIPDCNLATWTIERLELIEGAKLNLTNRFPFQPPYEPGGEDDVLYVKELVLCANSVLNTSYNWVYYGTLVGDLNAVTNIPMLGFSLINIALDDEVEFKHRVTHNNFIDLEPDPCDYTRIHVKRVDGNEPDPNGMMQMRNLLDLDPGSLQYQEVVNAQAKGLFAKASEDEDITIQFEYVFTADPCGDAELVVYLSDKPGLGENLVEVARVRAPALGRPGSVGSDKFAIFSGSFPCGSLNFIRGTYIELKLLGSANASCLINNWDPQVNCTAICGDFNIEMPFPLNIVNIYDYLVLLAEFGLSSPGSVGKGCLDLVKDGCINNDDLLAWGIDEVLNACGGGASASSSSVTGEALLTALAFEEQGAGESEPLLICGKPTSGVGTEVPGSYLYSVNTSGVCTSGPNETDSDGRLVTDSDGNIYQINGYLGLISLDTQTAVIEPNVIEDGNNLILVGFDDGEGFLLSDAVFKPGDPNIVYVVPVQVDPQDGNCPYMAAAKLQLTTGGNYTLLQLYGKNPATDPCQNNTLVDCSGDLVYEPDVQHLHEIEIDSEGNLFVLSSHWSNENNWLLIYDEAVGNNSEVRLSLSDTNIVGPTAMVVSSFSDKLYLASSVAGPNDLITKVYRFSINKVIPGLIFDNIVEVNCPEPAVCSYPSMCDAELGYVSMITSMIENPGDGTLYVTGFTAPKFPDGAVMSSWPYNQPGGIFTTPMLAEVASGANGMIEAVDIINSDLVLPFSLVWTGAVITQEKCGGADLDDSNDVDFADFAILASYWLETDCGSFNGCDGADLEPEDVPDADVDMLDLTVLAGHWLDTGCLN